MFTNKTIGAYVDGTWYGARSGENLCQSFSEHVFIVYLYAVGHTATIYFRTDSIVRYHFVYGRVEVNGVLNKALSTRFNDIKKLFHHDFHEAVPHMLNLVRDHAKK